MIFGAYDSIKVGANETFFLAQKILEFGAFDMTFGANEKNLWLKQWYGGTFVPLLRSNLGYATGI